MTRETTNSTTPFFVFLALLFLVSTAFYGFRSFLVLYWTGYGQGGLGLGDVSAYDWYLRFSMLRYAGMVLAGVVACFCSPRWIAVGGGVLASLGLLLLIPAQPVLAILALMLVGLGFGALSLAVLLACFSALAGPSVGRSAGLALLIVLSYDFSALFSFMITTLANFSFTLALLATAVIVLGVIVLALVFAKGWGQRTSDSAHVATPWVWVAGAALLMVFLMGILEFSGDVIYPAQHQAASAGSAVAGQFVAYSGSVSSIFVTVLSLAFFLVAAGHFTRLPHLFGPVAVGLAFLAAGLIIRAYDPILGDPPRLAWLPLIGGDLCLNLGQALIWATCYAAIALSCPPRFMGLVIAVSFSVAHPIQVIASTISRWTHGHPLATLWALAVLALVLAVGALVLAPLLAGKDNEPY